MLQVRGGKVARELVIHYRQPKSDLRLIQTAADIYEIFGPNLERAYREECIVVALDPKLYMLGWHRLSIGTLTSVLVDVRPVFLAAVRMCAAHIILIHNHPNTDCEVSRADIKLTRRIKRAGQILGINLIDHVIIGGNMYYSLKDHGEM